MKDSLALAVRRRQTLRSAWTAIQRNGRLSTSAETRAEIKKFAEDAPLHLERIQSQLRKNTFVFLPAKGIKAKKKGSLVSDRSFWHLSSHESFNVPSMTCF